MFKNKYRPSKQEMTTFKGKSGETTTSFFLKHIENDVLFIIDDLTISINGSDAQIDHVVLMSSGIYVIETKNWVGQIIGDDNVMNFIQIDNRNKKKEYYSPIRQNAIHVCMLKELLKLEDIFSCVVFTRGNIENIAADNVYNPISLKHYLNTKNEKKYSSDEMKTYYDILIRYKK